MKSKYWRDLLVIVLALAMRLPAVADGGPVALLKGCFPGRVPGTAAGQDVVTACPNVSSPYVVIDHESGKAFFHGYKLAVPLSDLKTTTVPLRPGDKLKIYIVRTNALVYSYDKEDKETEFADKTALFKYLSGLQAGLPLLAAVIGPAPKSAAQKAQEVVPPTPATVTDLIDAAAELVNVVSDLQVAGGQLLWLKGQYLDSLQDSEDGQENLGLKRLSPGGDKQDLVNFAKKKAKWTSERLRKYVKAFEKLARAREAVQLAALREKDHESPSYKAMKACLSEVDSALDKLPTDAYDLPREFRKVQFSLEAMKAENPKRDVKELTTLSFDWDKVHTVTVTATKKAALADKIAFKTRRFEKLTFAVSPEWLVQPAIGLGFAYAKNLTFPKYGTKKVADDTYAVETGTRDLRFQFFPMLSLAFRPVSSLGSWYSEAESTKKVCPRPGYAFTLDLGWNGKTDDPAYLLGASFVLVRQFKLGAGVIWQRRDVLDGTVLGKLAANEDLKTRPIYPPSLYFMFSVLGWPPFTSGN